MSKCKQQGFSLIEILVAFVITAIGLLGLSALQMMSIKNVNNTQFRTLATIYGYDMAERIRSNKVNAAQYVGADTSAGTPCSSCSGISAQDVTAWKNTLEQVSNSGGLPSAVDANCAAIPAYGTVTLSGDVYNVAITWGEQVRVDAAGVCAIENQTFTLSVRM